MYQNLVTSISPRPQVNDSQGDEVPTLSHLNKVDESTAKTTK